MSPSRRTKRDMIEAEERTGYDPIVNPLLKTLFLLFRHQAVLDSRSESTLQSRSLATTRPSSPFFRVCEPPYDLFAQSETILLVDRPPDAVRALPRVSREPLGVEDEVDVLCIRAGGFAVDVAE